MCPNSTLASAPSPAAPQQALPAVNPKRAAELVKTEPDISPRTGKPKRRKALRACIHCQRTHLTCDNNRPCERCVFRGLADTCRDGVRKKAKYLGEDEESKSQSESTPASTPNSTTLARSVVPAGEVHAVDTKPSPHALLTDSFSHSMPSPVTSNVRRSSIHPLAPTQQQNALMAQPGNQGHAVFTGFNGVMPPQPGMDVHDHKRFQSSAADLEYSTLSSILDAKKHNTHISEGSVSSPSFSDESIAASMSQQPHQFSAFSDYNQYTLDTVNINDLMIAHENNSPLGEWLDQPRPPPISLTVNDSVVVKTAQTPEPSGLSVKTPMSIYRNVRRPFPYTPGFHSLFRYIKQRFRKPELMQIVQSMAKYRPSFIAYSNSLTEDDLVFLEQCFQRALLEYEKYFNYWGTPTIIWRRTGQIAAVGAEFGMLTGWQVNDLVTTNTNPAGNKTNAGKFIIELMDDRSVVEYFKIFSSMSFGDSRGSTMTDCTLLTPQGKTIRTSSVLTLKRDLFGIPMLIIGNFLPVLTKN